MSVLGTIFIAFVWIVGILAVLLLLIIALPFDGYAIGHIDDKAIDGRIAIRWGWNLLAVEATLDRWVWFYLLGVQIWCKPLGKERSEDREKRDAEKARKKKIKEEGLGKTRESDKIPATASLRWIKDQRRWLLRLTRQVIEILHFRLCLQGVLGLDDPADTFLLFELLPQLERLPGVELDLKRDYLDDTIDLDIILSARIWLLEIIIVALLILLKRETWQALRAMPWTRR